MTTFSDTSRISISLYRHNQIYTSILQPKHYCMPRNLRTLFTGIPIAPRSFIGIVTGRFQEHLDIFVLCAGGDKNVTDAANGPPEAKDGDKSLGAVIKEILILFVVAVKKLV